MRRLLSSLSVSLLVAVVACSSSTNNGGSSSGTSGTSGGSGTSGSSGSSGSSGTSGSSGSSGVVDSGTDSADAAPLPFTLMSSALAEGATFAVANTCTGVNTSPPFTWTPGPAGTLSYAMVLTDKTNALVHWVIFDVPSATTTLPANIEKAYQPANVLGAKQTASFSAATRGYLGPCPPIEHTYEFALYAVDVASLPGADINTLRAEAVTLITAHKLAVTTLTGKYAQP